jgi:hypothetical protein
MRVHDVPGKFAVYYPHREGTYFIANRLHEEKRQDSADIMNGMLNLECV